jgi:hypothetical protein
MSADRVTKYVHARSRTVEWFWCARSYFEAAKSLALAYESDEPAHETLFSPLLYNLRHALELMLKFLAYSMGETPKDISHHDIHKVFLRVQSALGSLDDESLSFAASGLGLQKDLIVKALRITTEKVEALTNKYHSYTFLSSPIDDRNNELFRYPASTTAGAFSLAGCHTELHTAEISADIKVLYDFLWFVLLAFAKNNQGLHVLAGVGDHETTR